MYIHHIDLYTLYIVRHTFVVVKLLYNTFSIQSQRQKFIFLLEVGINLGNSFPREK